MVAYGHARSLLDRCEDEFNELVTPPDPLTVDGEQIGHGLPARQLPLDELRDLLLSPDTTAAAKDAAWVRLVQAAQSEGPHWIVGAIGVALPGLRNAAGRLARGYSGEVADLDAEVVAGFCERLSSIDPRVGKLAARLIWAAGRAGARARDAALEWIARHKPLDEDDDEPGEPAPHHISILDEAVRDGVLGREEAAIIDATRIAGCRLTDIARQAGLGYRSVWCRREKAERRLVEYLLGTSRRKLPTNWKNSA